MRSATTFREILARISWEEMASALYAKTEQHVERALSRPGEGRFEDFLALLSPAAERYVPTMQEMSRAKTRQRFGNIIQMYVPVYLSNECTNVCTYCGFSVGNKIERLTLDEQQMIREVQAVKALGFEHVLLVTGEASRSVGVPYFKRALEALRPHCAQISMEVQPLDQPEYEELMRHGLYAVLVYQETYHRERYREYHPKGKKANFDYRLETPERLGVAHAHKIGLGVLMGLEDWRVEAACLGLHLDWLERRYWRSRFSVSFPRLRPAEGAIEPRVVTSEQNVMQFVCALRLFNENVELSLSTRERPEFRDLIVPLGITTMSAQSRTEPGGYAMKSSALKQFEISDDRPAREIAGRLRALGLEAVWKDWEPRWHAVATCAL